MKYITFEQDGMESYGIFHDDKVYRMDQIIRGKAPATLADFIESGLILGSLGEIIDSGAKPVPLSEVKIKAPIPYPRREIICLGKNYEDHINEIKATTEHSKIIPSLPVYFGKSARPAIGSGDAIPPHKNVTDQIDYEAELAVVIGKKCSDIDESEVFSHIFGYTIINDVTARDLQAKHGQWYLGKSLAGFCPMGPVIADRSEIPSPAGLYIRSRVNGETRQNSNTKLMIFTIPYIVSHLSRGFILYPGDIIATGTPAGVGHGFDPPKNLRSGDTVECEIENIGVLINHIGG